jgi:hypothetical protein
MILHDMKVSLSPQLDKCIVAQGDVMGNRMASEGYIQNFSPPLGADPGRVGYLYLCAQRTPKTLDTLIRKVHSEE